ncbi:hypothetical protein TNCV_2788531 [Trichonephila clavipes]|uniref:Uncharacterized protein n=1 Tax=Trichonephila clavipes TaxID=2585209 RepID=A0A8X6SYM7_TRICX|nr:hypothetical protein TNCV_2788531 [Trichonephila clavipes]
MAPASRCMSENTCGCRMSWTYLWAAIGPGCHAYGSILGVTVYCGQWRPIPSNQLWEWCVAVKKRKD